MSISQRSGFTLLAWALCALAALAQTTPTQPGTAPAAAAPTAKAAATADPVLATVYKQPIRRSEVARLLSQFSIRPGDEERAYKNAMDMLINTKLLGQFLQAQKLQVTPTEIDTYLKEYEKKAEESNESLISQLSKAGMTMDGLRDLITKTLEWKKYISKIATDAELKKYADANKDDINGTRVRASHILIQVPPDATPAQKQQVKDKLAAIKKEIASGKISFADAANKYSEDPGNKETPNGGDLQYFFRKDPFIESFSAAAFALKPGQISDPVETEYGYHLIQVTDRQEGQAYDFAKARDAILTRYASERQADIIEAQRKKAEADKAIVIGPMPKDLINPTPPVTVPATTKGATAPATTKDAARSTPPPAAPKTETPKR